MGIQSQEKLTLLTDYDANSAYTLAYQQLFTNIIFSWEKELTQHTLLLVSPDTHVDSAAASINVAITAAQNRTPTILIDADLQNPSLQQRFGLSEHAGLSTLLADEAINPQKIMSHLHKTFIPNLTLLCAGPAIPAHESSRLFTHQLDTLIDHLKQILHTTEHTPGMIIFHSGAILSSLDATIISAKVEQTLLLLTAGHTTRTQAQQAQKKLKQMNISLTGVVMLDL